MRYTNRHFTYFTYSHFNQLLQTSHEDMRLSSIEVAKSFLLNSAFEALNVSEKYCLLPKFGTVTVKTVQTP